jgi:hypothetical protein
MSTVGFHMWEPFRQQLMAEHRFYVEQAKKRLLTRFDNIEAEATQARDDCLNDMSEFFNPDIHDPSDFYDASFNKGFEFYELLTEMRDNTRLSVVAGMFHQWDKKLRDWLVREVMHWHRGDNLTGAIWKANFEDVMGFLGAFGFDCHNSLYFQQLDAMRLVVNVFKHGDGDSFKALKSSFPEFLGEALEAERLFGFADYTDLRVTDEQVARFSEAILDFWGAIPNQIFLPDEADLPKIFEKALSKDINEANSANKSLRGKK